MRCTPATEASTRWRCWGVQLCRPREAWSPAERRVRPSRHYQGSTRARRPQHPSHAGYIRASTQFPPAGVRALLPLPGRICRFLRSTILLEGNSGPASHHRRPIPVGNDSALMRRGGEGTENCAGVASQFGRERSAKAAAARQCGETERCECARDEHADPVAQAGRGGYDLRGRRGSAAAKPGTPIHQGARALAFADCLVDRLRGIDLAEPCLQALDGPFALRNAQ